MHRLILSGVSLLVLAATASAQTVVLHEDFTVSVPPPGWSQNQNLPGTVGWIKSIDNRAWHEDEFGYTCDNDLITPVVDLSGYTRAAVKFATSLNWANYQANHPNSLGDGVTNIYVRTNGGAWSTAWTDTRINNTTDTITVDISALAAGQSNVEVAIHYYGTYAHEVWVDWLEILGNGTTGPSLTKTGTCPGAVGLSVAGATPNSSVAILYGGPGSFTQNNPGLPCVGLTVSIAAPTLGAVIGTDATGAANLNFNAPVGACGLTVQGVDLGACTATNTVTL
jgi:hypothetical protein